jgi:hypothetical protein
MYVCSVLHRFFWSVSTTDQTTDGVLRKAVRRLYHGTPYFQTAPTEYTSECDFNYPNKKKNTAFQSRANLQ